MAIEKPQTDISFWKGARLQVKAFQALRQSAILMANNNDKFQKGIDYVNLMHGLDDMDLYLEQIQDEQKKIINKIQLTLNNYEQSLGIGLMSTIVNPLDADGNSILSQDELKNPTIGVRPNLNSKDRKIVGFPIEDGGEELTALSPILSASEYNLGELDANKKFPLQNLNQQEPILVPAGKVIGMPFDITDMEKLIASGLPFGEIEQFSDLTKAKLDKKSLNTQQAYLCRYLTNKAVERVL